MTSTVLLSVAVATISGLLIGSFLTVVVERIPVGLSVVHPPSRCDRCLHRLHAVDLVPVVSWLSSRGRCRHCTAAIGHRPLVIELTTAAMFAALVLRHGPTWQTAAFAVLAAALVALTAIDLDHHRLPREISYAALAVSAPLLVLASLADDDPSRLRSIAVATVVATAAMLTLYVASRGGLGDGDVRLTPLLAAHLGWFGAGAVASGLLAGFVLGALVGVVGLVSGRLHRRSELPFGPFLAAGTLLRVFVG